MTAAKKPARPAPQAGPLGARRNFAPQLPNEYPDYRKAFKDTLHLLVNKPDTVQKDPAGRTLYHLFCDGLCWVDEAIAAAMAAERAELVDGTVELPFVGLRGRPRRIELSILTVALIDGGAPMPGGLSEGRDAVNSWLSKWMPASMRDLVMPGRTALEVLEATALWGWTDVLPGVVHADLHVHASITPINSACRARMVAGRPLVRSEADFLEGELDLFSRIAFGPAESDAQDISGLKERIFAVLRSDPGGNVGVRRRRQLQDLTRLALQFDGNPLGAAMLLGAQGLLVLGTVQKATPSDSILVRYIKEQIKALEAHPADALRLHEMDGAARGAVYVGWYEAAEVVKDARAALRAYDIYLSRVADVEPAVFAADSDDEPVRANPMILWEPEVTWIIDKVPKAARTPTIARVALAILAIIQRRPSRPSDLIHIQRQDVKALRDDKVAILRIRRRHGGLSQKTLAAQGAVELSRPDSVAALLAQKRFVEKNGGDEGPLWADTAEESTRLFTLACRLISSLCKVITGEPNYSIYAFRHTVFSQRIEEALLSGRFLLDPTVLDRISDEGGHESVETSVLYYFHLPMRVVRQHADRFIESVLEVAAAARWAKISAGAMRKYISRHEHKSPTPKLDAIRRAVPLDANTCVTISHPCQPALPGAPDAAPATLADVLSALAYVDSLRAQSRAGFDPTASLSDWEALIHSQRIELLPQYGKQIRLVTTKQAKWARLVQYVSQHWAQDLVGSLCDEWKQSTKAGYINASSRERRSLWLRFLSQAGVRRDHIDVRGMGLDDAHARRLQDEAAVSLRFAPTVDSSKKGYSRPDVYLLVSSRDIQAKAPPSSAQTSMAGLNVVMLAACVLRALQSLPRGEV